MSAWNRFLDRIRSPAAARVAGEKATSGSFDELRSAKYTLLVTHKRSGEPVPTPVWAGLGEDGKLYIRTESDVAKVKRIRNDPHVKVASCGSRDANTSVRSTNPATRLTPPRPVIAPRTK